ncbi:MAG: hypothetical protein GY730_02615 [bacterium]|nr:hypothetical protein [bacterium]
MNNIIKNSLTTIANYVVDDQGEQETYNEQILEGNSPLDSIFWEAKKALLLTGEQIEYELIELLWLWHVFGDIPINENDELDTAFFIWEKGTHREGIWHWFEEQNEQVVVGEMLYTNSESMIDEELGVCRS